ncbi:carboxypeptidase B-like [Anticarsia gemmatalis]|uniref:carboxypeptidase B-like n=1 Tax=Anticarsia gemmatalis TaxID=129554 RepID=UPI003F75ACA8
MRSFIIFCLSFYVVFAKHEIYDGHALYDINVKTIDEGRVVNDLENELLLDVWTHAVPGRAGQVLVPKVKRKIFENALKGAGVEYNVQVENIKDQLELEDQKLAAAAARSSRNSSRFSFDYIPTYEEVDAYLEDLARRYEHVRVHVAGTSVQGRPIKYLAVSTTNFQNFRKPIVVMQSLLHSREWVSLAATLYAIEKLVVDVTESDLLENLDWIIIPVVNPDGYTWTHSNARFWRKNRRTGLMAGDFCIGVDLNRNFNSQWSTASSSNVCADDFHGPGAMSEPETRAIANLLATFTTRIALFFDIHSFGSMILYGWGGNGVLPPHALTLNLVAVRMAQAIDAAKLPTNPNYVVGNIAHVLYFASGGASDFAMLTGVQLSYTYELPAWRNHNWSLNGFLVDPDFIEQAGVETWEGIKAGARYAIGNFRAKDV